MSKLKDKSIYILVKNQIEFFFNAVSSRKHRNLI